MKLSFRRSISLLCALALLVFATLLNPAAAKADDFTKATLVNADFSGQDLTSYEFTQATARNSKFVNANLTGVSSIGANFEGADFSGANLTYTLLDTARLTRANLTNAILVGASVVVTNFDGAIIDGADFTDVVLRKDVQLKLCQVAKGTNPTTGVDTRESLGCAA